MDNLILFGRLDMYSVIANFNPIDSSISQKKPVPRLDCPFSVLCCLSPFPQYLLCSIFSRKNISKNSLFSKSRSIHAFFLWIPLRALLRTLLPLFMTLLLSFFINDKLAESLIINSASFLQNSLLMPFLSPRNNFLSGCLALSDCCWLPDNTILQVDD